jgi:two-component system, NarL family, response regulator LiaR
MISVVIVEDHEATLKGLASELGAEPDIVVLGCARCRQEGLKMVQELKPTVVVLDLHLPDSSGPKSLTQAFAALNERIVILSGDTRAAIIQLVLRQGVFGYVLKSEPVAKVAEAIRAAARDDGVRPFVSPVNLVPDEQPKVTNAEQHLLKLLARGMKYNEIAAMRVTSPETVRKQIDALVTKLNLQTRERLIAWAVENGYGKLELQ